MPNLNYQIGRRLEYGRRKHWIKRGFHVLRSSGSHGYFDLCGIRLEDPQHPILLIQCKRVDTLSTGQRLINKFRDHPPLLPSPHYQQILEVSVKGSRDILSVTI